MNWGVHIEPLRKRSNPVEVQKLSKMIEVWMAFGAGGAAYVVKSRLNSDLVDAIRAVLSGYIFISLVFCTPECVVGRVHLPLCGLDQVEMIEGLAQGNMHTVITGFEGTG